LLTRTLNRNVARAFAPLLAPARYKGIYGGRGSGKSHFFAEQIIQDSLTQPGLRTVCIREVQKSLKESAKRLIEDKIIRFGLTEADGFKVFREVIETPGGGMINFQGMQDHTAESVKSLEGVDRAWVEEAQTLSGRSLMLLRPTLRADGSQMLFGWNPTRKSDPVDQMLRGPTLPAGAIVVKANWSENPWFPKALEQERQDCLAHQPDQYAHIWEGDYASVLTGAYFAAALTKAKAERRIGHVARDPILQIQAFWDIGFNDATAIWIAQFVGREIRVLDYYEAQGQPLATHLAWLRSRGWSDAVCTLPHDGANANAVTGTRYVDHVRAAGFDAVALENMGRGADMRRVEAARRLFPSIWFNAETTQPGIDALGWYHEKRDETRNLGLGPDHDWSSHAADAFGLMCVAYEEPRIKARPRDRMVAGAGAWMG
jgi:phage terminase large subunit